jgi:hypothetical protein
MPLVQHSGRRGWQISESEAVQVWLVLFTSWSTKQVSGQPRLHRETVTKTKQNNKTAEPPPPKKKTVKKLPDKWMELGGKIILSEVTERQRWYVPFYMWILGIKPMISKLQSIEAQV